MFTYDCIQWYMANERTQIEQTSHYCTVYFIDVLVLYDDIVLSISIEYSCAYELWNRGDKPRTLKNRSNQKRRLSVITQGVNQVCEYFECF